MFGAFLDAAMNIPQMMHHEEMQNDSQQFNAGEAQLARNFNASEALKSRDFNSAQAVVQRDWAEQMSNTQYQRAATDAQKAGLNRILAMRQGGAGNPSGSSASSSGASGPSGSSGISAGALHSAFNSTHFNELNQAQRVSETQRSYNFSADTEQKKQATDLIMEQTKTQKELTRQAKATAETATASAKGATTEGEIDETTAGEILRWINRISESLQGSSSAARRAKPH